MDQWVDTLRKCPKYYWQHLVMDIRACVLSQGKMSLHSSNRFSVLNATLVPVILNKTAI